MRTTDPKSTFDFSPFRFSVLLALTLLTSFVFSLIWCYSRNTISENGKWISGKDQPILRAPAASFFLSSRNVFSQNRLNLFAWHSYNELFTRDTFPAKSMDLDFTLDPGAVLAVEYQRDSNGYYGFELSARPNHTSRAFHATITGEFDSLHPLFSNPIDGRTHHLRLEASEDGNTIRIDEGPIYSLSVGAKDLGRIGFRQGFTPTIVDSVVLRDRFQKKLFVENFDNRQNMLSIFWLNTLAILFLGMCCGTLLSRLTQVSLHIGYSATAFSLLLAGLVYYGFDYHFWSSRYQYLEITKDFSAAKSGVGETFEGIRHWVFSGVFYRQQPNWKFNHPVGYSDRYHSGMILMNRSKNIRSYEKKANEIRLVFLGSSQTWGSGALDYHDTFVAHIHRRLSKAVQPAFQLTTWNLGTSGFRSGHMLQSLKKEADAIEPDFIIANLGHNDGLQNWGGQQSLYENLVAISEESRKRGAQFGIIFEPNASDSSFQPSLRNLPTLFRFSQDHPEVTTWNLYERFRNPAVSDRGFLWWDQVHFSSAGHKVMAELLTPEIHRWISNRKDSKLGAYAARRDHVNHSPN